MNPAGIIYAVLASCIWGIVPVFWRALNSIPVLEQVRQRRNDAAHPGQFLDDEAVEVEQFVTLSVGSLPSLWGLTSL